MNKRFLTLLACLISLLTGCGSLKKTPINNTSTIPQPTLNLNRQRPIIFLHGSGGSANDLMPFADRLALNSSLPISQLRVTINRDHHLTYLDKLTDKEQLPLIFVGFENSYAPIEEWADSLAVILEDLVQHYHFEAVDLVGFSNGGLAASYYAETQSNEDNLPQLHKLVIIGAPFNDLDPLNNQEELTFSDRSNQGPYFDKFLHKKEKLVSSLSVLSIAGDIEDGSLSDSVVPITSALASRFIFPDQVHSYEEKLSKGPEASHVGLVSNNQEVDTWVSTFLLDTSNPAKQVPPQLISSD